MAMNWNEKYLEIAQLVSAWSKDRSTKVGAAIYNPSTHAILSVGYNGFPRGVNDDVEWRHERPQKYMFTEHAERNAVYNAAMHGVALRGMGMALVWFPCADCARAVIQSGIEEIVVTQPDLTHSVWGESFKASKDMLEESNVRINFIDYKS